MAILTDPPAGKQVIDLAGPDGNAYFLLGVARNYGRLFGWDRAKMEQVVTEMKSGDYENLIQTFDKYFGEMCDLVRPTPEGEEDE